MPEFLKDTLELNLPQTSGKKSKVVLGVSDKKLAGEISAAFPGVECETGETSEVVASFLRGLRVHADKLLRGLQDGDIYRSQLGLGHAYSRAKVKFSVHKNDNHIIQGIATLDALDKGINSGAMRVREWYGWHFPELIRIVSDNITYAKLVLAIGDKKSLNDESVHDLADVVGQDEAIAQAIIQAAKISMGQDITADDLEIVRSFAANVVKMAKYRRTLSSSLDHKMSGVAPNLQTILGTPVAARLISHAGSLTNLSKYPASTLQILGAEKALFRALKTKGATPKYGLLYQSSFIGRSGPRFKGRISRYLANKCAMASRIDNFSENPTSKFGEAMRDQIEERIEFYVSGKKPTKNIDAMKKALEAGGDLEIDAEMVDHPGAAPPLDDGDEVKVKVKKDKKDKGAKKEKKDKKRREAGGDAEGDVKMEDIDGEVDGERKKKKKKSKHAVAA
jgi:nucleolar protein 56